MDSPDVFDPCWCFWLSISQTGDHKLDQVSKVNTHLANDHNATYGAHVRVLNRMGLCAQEFPERAKKALLFGS